MGKRISAEEALEIIWKEPKSKWPKFWWQLLRKEWPEEFGLEEGTYTMETAAQIMNVISQHCGTKACMRYENVKFCKMNDQLFDDYWDSEQKKLLYQIAQEVQQIPERIREQCAAECRKNGDRPIVTALRAFLFGCLGGLIGRLLFELFKLF